MSKKIRLLNVDEIITSDGGVVDLTSLSVNPAITYPVGFFDGSGTGTNTMILTLGKQNEHYSFSDSTNFISGAELTIKTANHVSGTDGTNILTTGGTTDQQNWIATNAMRKYSCTEKTVDESFGTIALVKAAHCGSSDGYNLWDFSGRVSWNIRNSTNTKINIQDGSQDASYSILVGDWPSNGTGNGTTCKVMPMTYSSHINRLDTFQFSDGSCSTDVTISASMTYCSMASDGDNFYVFKVYGTNSGSLQDMTRRSFSSNGTDVSSFADSYASFGMSRGNACDGNEIMFESYYSADNVADTPTVTKLNVSSGSWALHGTRLAYPEANSAALSYQYQYMGKYTNGAAL